MKTDPNEGAYPLFIRSDCIQCGLTKRELLAGLAMEGLLAAQGYSRELVSAEAVRQTDALIAALNEEADK